MKIKIETDFDTREEIALSVKIYKLDENGVWTNVSEYDFAYVSEASAFICGYLSALNEIEITE